MPAILRALGEVLPSPLNRYSVDNSKVTDHHAIIPTGEATDKLSTDESIIYQMIRTRFIEAFSSNSEEERMQVQFSDGSQTYAWKACRVLSLGWKAVAKEQVKPKSNDMEDGEEQMLSMLPNLTEGEVLSLRSADITSHKTKPKPLYTEATLLSAMESPCQREQRQTRLTMPSAAGGRSMQHAGREVEDSDQ